MTSGQPELIEHIRDTIRTRGPVSFAWFMEQALYHPAHGYYSSGRARIGRAGDYFSNVSVGPLFGRLMAKQFAEMWEKLRWPNEFKIVEQGAHDGQLAGDVLEAARESHPQFFTSLCYVIVEPFPVLKSRQMKTLENFTDKVRWNDSLDDLDPFRGVHFSNELIDAMPVHVIKWTGSKWLERHVCEIRGEFYLVDLPITNDELLERLGYLPTSLPVDYETEINLAALRWIDALAPKLEIGFVIAVDYGHMRESFFAPHRTKGTLQSYANHRVVLSPLAQVGHADITAHVDWTSLIERSEACGLTSAGFTDQHHFITGLLDQSFVTAADAKTKRALQTLLHPEFLGAKFQFLVLAKNVAQPAALAGLRFAQPLSRTGQ